MQANTCSLGVSVTRLNDSLAVFSAQFPAILQAEPPAATYPLYLVAIISLSLFSILHSTPKTPESE